MSPRDRGLFVALAAALFAWGCARKDPHAGHAIAETTGADVHTTHDAHDAGMPSGYAAVTIDAAHAGAIGFSTTSVVEKDFLRRLRTTGIVVVDETRTSHVHAKVRGFVEGISVSFVGQRVAAGAPLCTIYSQEVHAAEIEYLALLGRTSAETLPPGEFAERERAARTELVAAARRRLSLWDVPKAEIDRLESTREPRRTFPLLAPRGGIVVEKQALDGTFVDPSIELYTISDLSRLWVLADVYEPDALGVRVGQPARIEIAGAPAPIDASVAFLPPTIDEPTRTLKIRFELPNEKGALRPGGFATVSMDLALGRGLAIPDDAVIRTGTRAIVFVVHEAAGGTKHVMPRDVVLGPLVDRSYRIDGGLAAGDLVATGAQFLLDSETRLRATSAAGGGGGGGGHAGHGGH